MVQILIVYQQHIHVLMLYFFQNIPPSKNYKKKFQLLLIIPKDLDYVKCLINYFLILIIRLHGVCVCIYRYLFIHPIFKFTVISILMSFSLDINSMSNLPRWTNKLKRMSFFFLSGSFVHIFCLQINFI